MKLGRGNCLSILGTCLTCCSLLTASMPAETPQLVTDHTLFALSLYNQANPSADNFLFSPYSLASCLSLVYVGARGETQSQMQRVLQLQVDQKQIAKASASLSDSLAPKTGNNNAYRLINANSIWVDQGVFLLTDFRYAVEKQFKASLNTINFTQTQQALAAINSWVSQKTEQRIPHILSEEDLNEQTRLVLVNALYFQGDWALPFNPAKTHDWPFHPTPETSAPIKMMQQEEILPFYENELLQAVALPFRGKTAGGGDLAFLVILPKSAENLDMVHRELDNELANWLTSLQPTLLDLKIPKFTQDTRLNLKPILTDLGMENAFDSAADFTGIDGMRDLYLNQVIHQAYLSLDERGVLASAATAATSSMKSARGDKSPIPFYADHPFLYFIVDLNSHELLFMGSMAIPRSVEKVTFNTVGAPGLQQAEPMSKQPRCTHMGDADSCSRYNPTPPAAIPETIPKDKPLSP